MPTITCNQNAGSFWDRIAPKYARKPVSDPEAYDQKISYVRGLLQKTDRVLEIGCGTGSTALRLAPSVFQVTATDISRAMIEIAKSKLGSDAPTNINFLQAEASELIMDDRPFDAICAFSLLHLVDDIPQVLSSVRHQLRPGGLFFSKTVCLNDGPFPIRMFVRVLTALGVAPSVAALSKAELVQHLKDAGFEIETASYFNQQHTNPFIVARRPSV